MNIFQRKKNILVLGCNGMLGYDVFTHLKDVSTKQGSIIGNVIGLDVKDGYDFTVRHVLGNFFLDSIKFDYCINCIAHTNTSAAQNTKEGFIQSYKLNALLPKYIAESCCYHKVKLIHISTDYVFSENTYDAAINPNNSPLMIKSDGEEFPTNVYGMHKLIGELFVKQEFFKRPCDYSILRTSWLYGEHNNKSFIHKFLRNVKKCVEDGKRVTMTKNEYSIPTSTLCVWRCIYDVIYDNKHGIFNAVPECCQQYVSRCDFARHILKSFPEEYKIKTKSIRDIEISEVENNTYQPLYSMMKTSFKHGYDWQYYLNSFMAQNRDSIMELIENTP